MSEETGYEPGEPLPVTVQVIRRGQGAEWGAWIVWQSGFLPKP